jgi:hypothetical protein
MILINLIRRALLKHADDMVYIHRGEVVLQRGVIKRGGRKVAEGDEVVREEELDHLAELEGVAAGAGVVAELALACLGRVEGEEVPGDGGEGVEDAVAAVLEFSLKGEGVRTMGRELLVWDGPGSLSRSSGRSHHAAV